MNTWAEKIEALTHRSISDMADDAAQGFALTMIAAVLVAWTLMLI